VTLPIPPTWLSAPPIPEPKANQAHVYCLDLSLDSAREQQLRGYLIQEEQARADRFATRQLQTRFIAARGQLREILAAYVGTAPGELRFSYNPYGKPSLDLSIHDLSHLPGPLCFNLAHSGGLALLAVTFGQEVGVDLEDMSRPVDYQAIVRRYFSPDEEEALFALPDDQQRMGFFNGWARKEAYIKAQGMGLSIPLDSFSVTLSPTLPARFLRAEEEWKLYEISPIFDYAAALVSRGEVTKILCYKWNL